METYRVAEGAEVRLAEMPTDDDAVIDASKDEGYERLEQLAQEIAGLQDRLYAQSHHRVLLVLQGMDTAGKDSTIRDVFARTNPLGIHTVSFGRPSANELAHDYLWRIHPHTPARGQISIFNRSHYEDVVVVRVKELVEAEVWERRFDHLVGFERMLAEEDTLILKFFLHISADEQRERLQERIDVEDKRWKLAESDLVERQFWDYYQQAWSEAIERTSTAHAPWFVVPSDRKWYRKVVVATAVRDALAELDPQYPPASFDPSGLLVE